MLARLALLAAMVALPATAQTAADPARAVRNYQAVANGSVPLASLSAQERAEVGEVDRIVRNQDRDRRTLEQRCRDGQRLAGSEPTALERAVIDLRCGR